MKPCPYRHCQSEDVAVTFDPIQGAYHVECMDCGCRGPLARIEKDIAHKNEVINAVKLKAMELWDDR